MPRFETPEDELAWLMATQEDGGLSKTPLTSPVEPQVLDYFAGPDSSSRDPELTELLQDAMDELPDDVRDIVEAHVFQGMGVRRISRLEWVEWERTAVHDRLRAGLAQLREALEDHPKIKEHLTP